MKKKTYLAMFTCAAALVAAATPVAASTYTFQDAQGEVYSSESYDDDTRITAPATPEREGYYFGGWYEDEEYTDAYSDMKKYSGDVTFTAKWLQMYTFEAENTQLTDLDPFDDDTCNVVGQKLGQSYSGNVSGTGLINGCECDASNDAYVTNLYYNGAYLQFEIQSDADVDDALLFLRLSGEYTTININDETFLVTVNDEDISYGAIEIVGGSTDDLTSSKRTPMTDYAMGTISLNEGENIIRLTVNNSEKQFATGTMDAAAPMVDCVKIYANAGLTMTEYDN